MKQFEKVVMILGAVVACSNPVEPRQKLMEDPPIRIDPTPSQSGLQLNQPQTDNP